jgi:DNA-binding Xre family transcriptional regulator
VHFNLEAADSKATLKSKDIEQQIFALAAGHRDVKLMRYNFVLDDYNQIAYKRLNSIRNSITGVPSDIIALIPAARWLFDNYQMMYRQIKKVRTSGTSYEVLPILKAEEYRGYPRVYILAKKLVALSSGHLNYESISAMLRAYQKEIPLTDKEIWVLPEVIGFCLLENIIEVADDILKIIKIKAKADRIVKEKMRQGKEITDIAALLCETEPDCKDNYSFHSHVIYLLKNMSFNDTDILRYVEYHCKSDERQINPSHVFQEEGKIESHLETIIRALIISLREINEIDEESFFDEFSSLEHILSKDPDCVYPKMDSESRGMYRGIIVKLALKYKLSEVNIANECLKLAVEGRDELNCSHHVGTYLIGSGYKLLKAKALRKPLPDIARKKNNIKGSLYFVTYFLILTAFIMLLSLVLGQTVYIHDTDIVFDKLPQAGAVIIMLLISLPLLMGISQEITNHIFTRGIHVKKIPALDYLNAIPDSARTFIVMPVIVSSKEQGLEYLERLHKHYLANRQDNLYYALLADYMDASAERMPSDDIIEEALINRLKELNELYPSQHQRFCLFIRYRRWNPSEKCYMCWERKRGKLEEFNSLLCGNGEANTSFSHILCSRQLLGSVKYVITLDADSNLIRDNAAKLVGLIDHPINRPVLDMEKKCVKDGYVIIQPSVRNHIPPKNCSRFTLAFGGQSGLDSYSTVISDIYQDIFNQGIYTGKGIYHVQAFHYLLHDVIKENRVLSHDLLESCFARTAFSSTARIMDTFPSSVLSYIKREHRWIRGDWQLIPWLFTKGADGKSLCALSKWKIFDNLRRSMVPICKTLFIILNLAIFPGVFYVWLPLVFFNDFLNLIILLITIIAQKISRPKLALLYRQLFRDLWFTLERAFIELVLTPYRAYVAADAAIRTLFRLIISKRNLLKWNTAEAVDASILNTKKGYFLSMWSSLIPTAIILLLLYLTRMSTAGVILYCVVAVIWLEAFYLAYYISKPRGNETVQLHSEDRELLLDTSRNTWQFFKQLSTRENNWLCPDNYQITNAEKITDKTSPTNIGLQFLAILSARDLGYETLNSTISRIEKLLDTVIQLPKWKGHLYNWYQINTLGVLNPEYISTVDSGNFLGHLIALKNGMLQQMESPIIPECLLTELKKTAGLCNSEFELKDEYLTIKEFLEDITDIWDEIAGRKPEPKEDPLWFSELSENIEMLVNEISCFKLKDYTFNSCPNLKELALQDNKKAKVTIERINNICKKLDCIIANMDFSFLFNRQRLLFHIGYHVGSHSLDSGCYDLMASESALTSFLAIARGEIPLRHWYRLGRPLTIVKGVPCFVSWSGTMFEYLMPNLVLKEYFGSVYSETSRAAVLQQMHYAKLMDIPWGISESQYYRFDLNANYQYRAFGVPKLRLQPVRKNSLVVSPYSTMLALEYADEASLSNLRRLKELGVYGKYGFYEAVDFNGPDAVNMKPYRIVTSFMTHHQGMNLVAINNFLNNGIMKMRFHSEALVKSAEVLLEEKRQSYLISLAKRGYTINVGKIYFRENLYSNRYVNSTNPAIPVVCYLSNNKYSLMITSDGDGFSKYMNMMLHRWRADIHANTGQYIYIKDMSTGKLWSSTYHPTRTEPDEYQAVFSPYQAEFKRTDGDISTHTQVSLSPSYNIEIRKVKLINHAKEARSIEITSYLEVVADSHMAELSHPAFNKLFIESEFIDEQSIFLSKRRSGKAAEKVYLMHMVKTGKGLTKKIEYENDRLKFIGRNNSPQNPIAVVNSIPLSNQAGFCNDPIMSLRVTITIPGGETAAVSFITGVCDSREDAIKINEELDNDYRIDDVFEKFKLQSEIELKYLEINRNQLNAFQDLISPIFYPSAYYRGPEISITKNNKNQSFLWRFGISGDNPITLLTVKSVQSAGIIKDVLKAYEYLRINRVNADLVIMIETQQGYMQEVDNLINDMTSSLRIYDAGGDRPSLYVLHTYDMSEEEINLLYTVACVVFSERTGIYFRNIKEEPSDSED